MGVTEQPEELALISATTCDTACRSCDWAIALSIISEAFAGTLPNDPLVSSGVFRKSIPVACIRRGIVVTFRPSPHNRHHGEFSSPSQPRFARTRRGSSLPKSSPVNLHGEICTYDKPSVHCRDGHPRTPCGGTRPGAIRTRQHDDDHTKTLLVCDAVEDSRLAGCRRTHDNDTAPSGNTFYSLAARRHDAARGRQLERGVRGTSQKARPLGSVAIQRYTIRPLHTTPEAVFKIPTCNPTNPHTIVSRQIHLNDLCPRHQSTVEDPPRPTELDFR